MPQDTANKNLCENTQDAQTLLVTPTKGMAYIHGTATKVSVCIDNSQHPLIIDSRAHCSIVDRKYLDNHFPNWEEQLFPTKAKSFKSASGKMTSIGTIIKDIIIPHRKGFLLGTDYQRMYGIDIYNSKNRHITIGTNKKKKFPLDIYQICSQDPLEDFLNEFREGQLSTTLTSKQKLSLLKMLRKNRPAFAIGEKLLGKIKGQDIGLYLDMERTYPPMLRRPPYPASLETRSEIEKHINELLDMVFIRKIGHNEIVEITTPVLITWNDGKSRLCGDFRALNIYTKVDRYAIPRIPHALDQLAKAKYITKMDCMEGFHQNGVKPKSMKLLRIICHMGIYEYTRMPFGIKNAPTYFQRMMDTIFQKEILEVWMVVYIDDIITPGRILCQSLAIGFMSHRVGPITSASRKHQLSHVSHKNVTQSPNPFHHYLQCLGNLTSLASASPPNPSKRFAYLCARTTLQMRLRHFPPSLSSPLLTLSHPRPYHLYAQAVPSRHASNTANHPYACVVPSQHFLPSLSSRSALPTCSQHCLPSLRLRSALPACSQHHLSLRFCITSIVYGGLLAYTMNAIAEIC
ncbi:hypothetical protein O181_016211 [Austropuccinia psidii MF-1]|uniref:Reverse transcriptase domain-containing protein n=1 Tax=Austropuccinia psidii MF-1 TaxID=1389203 RepID=A0A9Q3C563_9BASI|nr:hypothetical protein [Austropuccinia psidii MF-1]